MSEIRAIGKRNREIAKIHGKADNQEHRKSCRPAVKGTGDSPWRRTESGALANSSRNVAGINSPPGLIQGVPPANARLGPDTPFDPPRELDSEVDL